MRAHLLKKSFFFNIHYLFSVLCLKNTSCDVTLFIFLYMRDTSGSAAPQSITRIAGIWRQMDDEASEEVETTL